MAPPGSDNLLLNRDKNIKGTLYHSYFSWSETTLRKVYLTYEYRYVIYNIYLKRKKSVSCLVCNS